MPRPSRFDLVAGCPALDLVNTVSWRGDPARTTERVGDFGALVSWALRAGVVDEPSAREVGRAGDADADGAQRATSAVAALREDLHAVLSGLIDDGRPDDRALMSVHAHIATAITAAVPGDRLPLDWSARFDRPVGLYHALGLEALRLLRDADPRRIGCCSDPACGWLFLDHSRNRSRRWCSSGDCGNRDRVSRHHQRQARAT
jgi:predicted RNA-binding Zn ribbon-like protein